MTSFSTSGFRWVLTTTGHRPRLRASISKFSARLAKKTILVFRDDHSGQSGAVEAQGPGTQVDIILFIPADAQNALGRDFADPLRFPLPVEDEADGGRGYARQFGDIVDGLFFHRVGEACLFHRPAHAFLGEHPPTVNARSAEPVNPPARARLIS